MTSCFKLSTLGILSAIVMSGCSTSPTSPQVQKEVITINSVSPNGIGERIGTISLQDSQNGLVISTDLSSLPPGPHGFHIHEKGSCEAAEKDGKMVAALAAGGHYNPHKVNHHGNPTTGHLGDLPLLNVENNGVAKVTLIAPRLTLNEVKGLAIMIHAGGDNYSDDPKPLGGGGDRIACGVIN